MKPRCLLRLIRLGFLIVIISASAMRCGDPETNIESPKDIRGYFGQAMQSKLNPIPDYRSMGETLVKQNSFFWEQGKVGDLAASGEHLWATDYTNQTVHKFSTTGEPFHSFSGEGEAPWEHQGITSISLWNDSVITFDHYQAAFRFFSEDGTFGRIFTLEGLFSDGVCLSGNLAILIDHADYNSQEFVIYDLLSKKEVNRHSNSSILQKTVASPLEALAFQGELMPIPEGGAYFFSRLAGLTMKFDQYGNIEWANTTIDGTIPPKVSQRQSGHYTFHLYEPETTINREATGTNEELFILSNVRFTDGDTRFIDVYDGQTGTYLRSIEVPNLEEGQLPTEILIGQDNELHVLYEDLTFVTYHRQPILS